MSDIAPPLAVVTRATTGIGYELAKCCATRGFDLIITGDEEQIHGAADALRTGDVTVCPVTADLSTIDGIEALWSAIADAGRPLDYLLVNADRGYDGSFVDQDMARIRRIVDTNITGILHLIHKAANTMRRQGHGRILITGSIAGFIPGTYQAVYNGTKAFLDSFSHALRYELWESGVTVTCLMPGATATDFFEQTDMSDARFDRGKRMTQTDVARLGFDAMMHGDGEVVPDWQNKLRAAVAQLLPAAVAAEMHRRSAEPHRQQH